MTTINTCMQDVLETYSFYYEENDGVSPYEQFISDLSIWLEDQGYEPLKLKE